MSDDEFPMSAGADVPADDFDAGMLDRDDGETPDPKGLPEGVTKEILTAASADNWKTPQAGDEVTVHYVGTLQADGSEFDSSRSRGTPFVPFVFTLGKGNVIKGWDLGVGTMRKGEIAKFTLAPEYAYGESGSPPKIPSNATLIFEVELISWASKDDLFGDDGVVKTTKKDGLGYKKPNKGDEVLLSLKIEDARGAIVDERRELEYTLGSDKLGSIGKACDKALESMKQSEEACLRCSKDYAYDAKYPEGVTINLTLHQIYETMDVSFQKDKSVMKKQIQEGEGYDRPKDDAKVKLSVIAATDGMEPLSTFVGKTLEFTAGHGEVCDALEWAVAEMKKGEKAVVTVTHPSRAAEEQLGLTDLSTGKVVITLQLLEFEKGKNQWDLSEEEKVELGSARKEIGGNLFRRRRLEMALQRYKNVSDMFSYVGNFKEENKSKAEELKRVCELNKAACFLQLKDYLEAKKACDTVLKNDGNNIKAIFRRAQALYAMKEFRECICDCKRVAELDPQNRDARVLLQQASTGQKAADQESKGLFANMCKALGKGPIPEAHKAKLGGMDEDCDEDIADVKEGQTGDNSADENKENVSMDNCETMSNRAKEQDDHCAKQYSES